MTLTSSEGAALSSDAIRDIIGDIAFETVPRYPRRPVQGFEELIFAPSISHAFRAMLLAIEISGH
jgi:hypothetical protein